MNLKTQKKGEDTLLNLTPEQLKQPFLLKPNRVRRTYRGGLLLDRFRRYSNPQDGWVPEDWLGSTTMSRFKTRPGEGLSMVSIGEREFVLGEVIKHYPQAMLGEKHTQALGAHPFLLTKLLDSSERLRIQVHPSREQAQALFGSPHGKAEAWYILETRTIDGVEPYILLGFRKGIRAQDFAEALLNQDSIALIEMMHRVTVQAGDIFMVDAGVPHAIGSGVFMLEIQEPSDLTVYAEASGDTPLDHSSNHLGLGWQQALELFQYEGDSAAENLAKRKLLPERTGTSQSLVYETMMGDSSEPYFGLSEILVRGQGTVKLDTFTIAIVIQGSGTMDVDGHSKAIHQGDALFCPAILGEFTLSTDQAQGDLRVLCCRPASHYL